MPSKTNTERIQDLSDKVAAYVPVTELRLTQQGTELVELRARIQALIDALAKLAERLAVLEQRCAALEKHTDRTWQVWLALLAAGLSLAIHFVKK